MNNFVSVFEELSKLYEADEVESEVAVEEVPEEEVPMEETPVEEPIDEEPKKVILECSKCGALVIKDEADVKVDEETDLANVEDECAFCEETAGYTIVGAMVPYEVAEDDDIVEEAVETPAAEGAEKEVDDAASNKADNDSESNEQELVEEMSLTEGKLIDNVKKVATRVGADAATIVRCFTELGEMAANIGNKGEYKTTKLNDFMEYVENKAALKALMNGNEEVMNGITKEDIEELKQDIEDYKKAKADKKAGKADDEELEELLDVKVDARGFGGEGNDVSVL